MTKGKARAKKTMAQARGKQDKAQNVILKDLTKKVNDLTDDIEVKYQMFSSELVAIQGWDPSAPAGGSTSQNIFPVRFGATLGTSDNDRIGDSITVKSIELVYGINGINGAVASQDAYNRIRCVLFWDKKPVKSIAGAAYTPDVPQWNQMLQYPVLGTTPTPAGSTLPLFSPYDHDTGGRFTYIHDKLHGLTSNGNVSTAVGTGARGMVLSERVYKSYKRGKKIKFTSGGVTPNNLILYLGFISDSRVTAHPYVTWCLRVNYTDA